MERAVSGRFSPFPTSFPLRAPLPLHRFLSRPLHAPPHAPLHSTRFSARSARFSAPITFFGRRGGFSSALQSLTTENPRTSEDRTGCRNCHSLVKIMVLPIFIQKMKRWINMCFRTNKYFIIQILLSCRTVTVRVTG